jgi:hypothetical protein
MDYSESVSYHTTDATNDGAILRMIHCEYFVTTFHFVGRNDNRDTQAAALISQHCALLRSPRSFLTKLSGCVNVGAGRPPQTANGFLPLGMRL